MAGRLGGAGTPSSWKMLGVLAASEDEHVVRL